MRTDNEKLQDLEQYPIERSVFEEIFKEVENIVEDIEPFENNEFKVWRFDSEIYILHKYSGTMVNWYKHLGRCNTCNKDFTVEDYKEFVRLFLDSIED